MYVEDNVLNEDKITGEFDQEAEFCGVDEEFPSPSSPLLLRPQHATEPLSRLAQVWPYPPARSMTNRLESMLAKLTGEVESVVFPVPCVP